MLLSIIWTPGFLFLYFSLSSSISRSYYFPINTTLFIHLSVSILVRADANSSDSCRATERQYVFAMGNFIEFELDRIGHIDAIFVHELTHECRLFVKITEAQRTGRCNPVLNLPLLRLGGQELIIGLPLINAKKLYIVPLDKEMVLVDWSIQYLWFARLWRITVEICYLDDDVL